MISCQTIKISNFTAPEEDCASESDLDFLADTLPLYDDNAMEAMKLSGIMNRIIFSAGYCQEARKQLR